MTESAIVVTGANGFVGARLCEELARRGATVRAVVRREGVAPQVDGVEEWVGDFGDPELAARVVDGASAVVSTVHPMDSDRGTQHRVAVEGTPVLARAASDAGVDRFVHLSTAAVYDRSPGVGDVDESGALVGDDANDYAATKRDTDAALAEVPGLTTVLVRPPAILGSGPTSVWNTLRPQGIRDREDQRHAIPDQTFAWVHVDDFVTLLADLATARIAAADDPAPGPVADGCTAVNAAAAPATVRDYYETVAKAAGVDPIWDDRPAWTGRLVADRAHGWGWSPTVSLEQALDELDMDVRDL